MDRAEPFGRAGPRHDRPKTFIKPAVESRFHRKQLQQSRWNYLPRPPILISTKRSSLKCFTGAAYVGDSRPGATCGVVDETREKRVGGAAARLEAVVTREVRHAVQSPRGRRSVRVCQSRSCRRRRAVSRHH